MSNKKTIMESLKEVVTEIQSKYLDHPEYEAECITIAINRDVQTHEILNLTFNYAAEKDCDCIETSGVVIDRDPTDVSDTGVFVIDDLF